MKKRMFLKPNISKRKIIVPEIFKSKNPRNRNVKLNIPIKERSAKTNEPMQFEDWTNTKKRGSRTSSDANLRMKPAKWIPPDPESEQEFEKWS